MIARPCGVIYHRASRSARQTFLGVLVNESLHTTFESITALLCVLVAGYFYVHVILETSQTRLVKEENRNWSIVISTSKRCVGRATIQRLFLTSELGNE